MIRIVCVPGRPGWYQAMRGSQALCEPTTELQAQAVAIEEADVEEIIDDRDGEEI